MNIKPKQFISGVLINEMKMVVDKHPYFSFLLISVGIEFLGKCLLTTHPHWDNISPKKAFDKGASLFYKIDEKYKELNLRDELRNGLAHTILPKSKIVLSQTSSGAKNFHTHKSSGKTVLVIEEFYRDFVIACTEVINTEFSDDDKMNKDFLYIGS